ncbi:hypothetical protein CLV33_101153 [Jejuia pallidilutea]|uniref:Uncharacterized protein n=1 Tax=Jejuia pallidilutea TaxID=504487 RepID=A0A362XAJ2_9FLAO|nr:hypothetical protein CLV33_101153 [Jejuia pallidilutea]
MDKHISTDILQKALSEKYSLCKKKEKKEILHVLYVVPVKTKNPVNITVSGFFCGTSSTTIYYSVRFDKFLQHL